MENKKKLSKDEKRSEKLKNRTLRSFKPIYPYLFLMCNPVAICTNFKTFAVILKEFFFIQFFRKFNIIKIPVVSVDHPLDDKIPFTPKKITVYLDFINYWVRPFSMLISRIGIYRAALTMKKWMRHFRKLYILAGQIYHFRLTTTNRPDYNEMKEFRQIHAVDPHFLCVPSLHIATIILVFGFYRQLFRDENFTQDEQNRWLTEMYSDCISIADAVLYVKQHSVNCVPAALYMVASNFSEYVSVDDARKFLDDMFKMFPLEENFAESDSNEVKAHMKTAFENYLVEGSKCTKEEWYKPINTFLENYGN